MNMSSRSVAAFVVLMSKYLTSAQNLTVNDGANIQLDGQQSFVGSTNRLSCGINIGTISGKSQGIITQRNVMPQLPKGCIQGGDTIQVAMDNNLKVFNGQKQPRSMGENYSYWAGTAADGSKMNLVEDERGVVFGSVVDLDNDTVMQLAVDSEGNPTATLIHSMDFPDEGSPYDSGETRYLLSTEEVTSRSNLRSQREEDLKSLEHRNLQDDGSRLDVMVVWTKYAECRNSNAERGCSLTTTTAANMRSKINLAVAESNEAFRLSGINTQLRLVHAYRDPSYTEISFDTALNHITSKTDGVMDDVHAKRETYRADLVAMLIDNPQVCGLAWLGPSKDRMFSVTSWNCATGYYSFVHEIGHNLGCNHDRGSDNKCSDGQSNFGYRDPGANFRTIMSYNCKSGECDQNAGGGCTRIQRFSNPNTKYNNRPLGNAQNNNVQQINSVLKTVAQYYPSSSTTTTPPSTLGGTCGSGSRGNGICADGTCCSAWGWCGCSNLHCANGSTTSGCASGGAGTGNCGGGSRGNGICADGTCCSPYGWCDCTPDHCLNGRTPICSR